MNRLIVLVGAHSSGKTTLGRALAKRLGWHFDDEIGYRLRMNALLEDPNQLADVRQSEFDRRVCAEECLRDSKRDYDAVVETWHGGNLAYIAARSPEIYQSMCALVCKHLQELSVEIVVVPLQIKLSTLEKRQREAVSEIRFFHEVGQQALTESATLNLRVVDPVNTDCDRSIEECLLEIRQKITNVL